MSSLKDLASLIMIPSLVKDGRLDTVKPLGNSIIHPDATGNNDGTDGSTPAEGNFTFSRGSNLAATRVDVNGLIEKGRENLALQSNTFSSGSWYSGGLTETSGQSGYDGSLNAWLIEAVATGTKFLEQNISSGVNTLSIYAKAGTTDWIMLNDGGGSSAYFDIANGVLGSNSGADYIDHSIESISSGWYRCSLTSVNIGQARIYLAAADGNLSNSIGNNILIQDAQLEQGLVATPYIETGASTAQAGILEDLPRLDYSGGASCPSLLLEPQRSNLVTQSEYFGGYTTTETNVTANTATSPEGVQNASSVIETSATNNHRILPSAPFAGTGSAYYSMSVYVKKISGQPTRHIYWMCQRSSDVIYAHFDMDNFTLHQKNTNGTASNVDADIISVGNDWYRLTLSGIVSTAAGDFYNQLYFETTPRTGFNAESYTGNGSSGFEIYGWQIEAASYPTSYIPTYGSAVTRSNDSCFATSVSDLIGQEQGTIFIDANLSAVTDTNLRGLFEISDGTSSNRISIYRNTGGTQATLYSAFSGTATLGIQFNTSAKTKIAFNYSSSGVTLYVNGSLVDTDSVVSIPACNRIDIGVITQLASRSLGDSISQVSLFKTALTNAELAALTTI